MNGECDEIRHYPSVELGIQLVDTLFFCILER